MAIPKGLFKKEPYAVEAVRGFRRDGTTTIGPGGNAAIGFLVGNTAGETPALTWGPYPPTVPPSLDAGPQIGRRLFYCLAPAAPALGSLHGVFVNATFLSGSTPRSLGVATALFGAGLFGEFSVPPALWFSVTIILLFNNGGGGATVTQEWSVSVGD